jgi:hypothetical protein
VWVNLAFCVGVTVVGVATLVVSLPLSCGVLRLVSTLFDYLCRHRDTHRRFASFVSCDVPRLIFTLFGITFRRRDDMCRDARS